MDLKATYNMYTHIPMCVSQQVFCVEISETNVFCFFFCFRSVYLGLDEESFASIKDSVKEFWNLIG